MKSRAHTGVQCSKGGLPCGASHLLPKRRQHWSNWANNSPLKKDVRRKLLVEEIDQAVVQAHHLQVPRPEFLDLVHERLDLIEEKQRESEAPKPN